MHRPSTPIEMAAPHGEGALADALRTMDGQLRAIRGLVEELRESLGGRRKDFYTVEEFAELTGRAPYTVRSWAKQGLIAATRVAGTGPRGRLLIHRNELSKLVASGRAGRVDDLSVG